MRDPVAAPGFAAPLALCMLAVVGALAAASLHAVAQGRRSATRFRSQEQAASIADLGLQALLASWDAPRRDSLPIGGVDSSTPPRGHADLAGTRVFVTRITSRLFWLEAAGRTAAGTSVEARKTHRLLVEVLRPVVPTSGTMTSRGDVLLGSEAVIVATDTPPPGWPDCPPADGSTGLAVLVPEGASARDEDGRPVPGSAVDEAAGRPESYEQWGELSTTRLAAQADVTVAAGGMLSPGDAAVASVTHAGGDLTVTGAGGRGVLLVGGRLSIRGPFSFAGVILAGRGIDASGPDVSIYGTVLSGGTEGVVWRASGAVRRSTCAVGRATTGAARPFVLGRGWAELF